jgi:hypothetical protein
MRDDVKRALANQSSAHLLAMADSCRETGKFVVGLWDSTGNLVEVMFVSILAELALREQLESEVPW